MRSLIPWSSIDVRPLGSLAGFQQDMDRLLGKLQAPSGPLQAGFPRLDWTETEEAIVLTAEVPGIDPEELEITVMGEILTLTGEKRAPEVATTYSERWYGKFRREVQLPCAIATDGVRAACSNGILSIHMPKSEAERPHRIDVHVG